ncbi:MAG: SRPBCC family protein [Acidobacteriota bacterium]|nr:SRPBCC family protein [Acidobacteriota bacterium]
MVKFLGYVILIAVIAAGAVTAVGSAIPRAHEVTRSARFDMPAHRLYPALITPETFPEWRSGITRVERLDSDRFVEHGPHGPIRFRIMERQPPSRLVVAVDDPEQVFTGTWTYELIPEATDDAQTRLRITERGEVSNPFFRAVAKVMQPEGETMETYLKDLGRRFGQTITIDPPSVGTVGSRPR